MSLSRDLEFLYELGSLRNIQRGCRQHFGVDCSNDLEHTMRVVFLALAIGRREGNVDENKIIRMALVHDLAETRVSDLSYVQKVYVTADEPRAVHDALTETIFADFESVIEEFEKRESREAKIVKDADNLDIDLEWKELEERGHGVVNKMAPHRRKVRDEKLYTQTARDFWDAIQTSDPASWHLTANKWLKMPDAGR